MPTPVSPVEERLWVISPVEERLWVMTVCCSAMTASRVSRLARLRSASVLMTPLCHNAGALAWYNLASLRMRENAWIEQSFVS